MLQLPYSVFGSRGVREGDFAAITDKTSEKQKLGIG
jgi:hypothetical protein